MSETEIIVKMDRHLKIKGGSYVQDLVRCKDCKHYGKFGMKCNKLHLTPIESWRYCSHGERAEE